MIGTHPLVRAAAAARLLIAASAVGASGEAPSGAGVARSGETPIRALLARATAVVAGRPGEAIPFDEGRLLVHPLRVDAVVRGTFAGEVTSIVEIRGTSRRPPLLGDAEPVVVLLAPARTLSYYRAHLPPGELFEPVAGRDGVIPLRSEADLETTRTLLDQGAAAAALPAGDERREALRALAFAELASRNPRWTADGLLELRTLPADAELTTDEVSTLSGVLRDTTIPAPVRVRLLGLLAEQRWVGARDVVAVASVDEPAVFDALLEARGRLGIPAGLDELRPHLESTDPRLRAAAVRALASVDDPKALADLGRFATRDPDVTVQTAAIDALAGTGRDAAVPYVAEAFIADVPAVRQASARALLTLGGQRKTEALAQLAREARDPDARHYAAVALVLSTSPDDPAVQRLRAETTDPKIQRLFEHGIELKAHRHDD